MKIAIYVRVSTDEQVKSGHSIDNQKERLIAFCTSQGWDDYSLYIDDGYTGTNLNRPALKRMVSHVEEKRVDAVIVYKLDRLSRRQQDVLYLLEDVFEKNECVFKSATEPFDTSTPLGKAMIGILAVFAQLERDMIIERMTAGRRARTSKGMWYGGRIPYGYNWDKEKQELTVNHEQARIVKHMYAMYLKGASRLEIAEWAESRTNERVLNHSTVRDILTRVLYTGKLQNKEQLVDGNHEAIIDTATFEAVQREYEKRRTTRFQKGKFLLTGLMKCGICGGNVVNVKRKSKYAEGGYYHFYTCKDQHVRAKDTTNDKCWVGYHRRQMIEDKVIKRIKDLALDDELVKKEIEKSSTPHEDQSGLINELNEKLKETVVGLENLYEAIQIGEIKASFVSGRITKLEEERERIQTQIDDLSLDSPAPVSNESVIRMIKKIHESWDYIEEEEKSLLLRTVIDKVVLKKHGEIDIKWNFVN
ncbi:recombinase family protein [Bacillus sp. A301a_S52]|nr:recombinase family protein [Bacillus sp. A301a_S52]